MKFIKRQPEIIKNDVVKRYFSEASFHQNVVKWIPQMLFKRIKMVPGNICQKIMISREAPERRSSGRLYQLPTDCRKERNKSNRQRVERMQGCKRHDRE